MRGRRAKEALMLLEPYLTTKKAQAQIALLFPVGAIGTNLRHPFCEVSQAVCCLALKRLNN